VTKSYKERLDPDGELGQLAAFFASPVGRLLGRLAGVAPGQGKELAEQYRRLTSEPDRVADALSPLGWILFGSAPLDEYAAAATLVEQGNTEEAEALLVHAWNDEEIMLNQPVHRLFSLYSGDEEREAIREQRQRLLREAVALHREGRYAASISMVLAQMDGVFLDITGETIHDYFFKPKNPNLLDEETLAGHPLGLQALSKLMSKRVETTGATGELLRHGILHGRELAYDTLANSTKAWAALFAVIDGVKKRADVLNKAAAEARERRYAGSKELDEYARRLDRRGFDGAKKLLQDISAAQFGSHKRRGRYAAGRKELDPSGRLLDGKTFELRTSDDGQEYWAWVDTPTGLVFGIAGRGGDHAVWQYQGEQPPAGGIDSEAGWRHVVTDEALPDW